MATQVTYVRTDSLDERISNGVEDVVFFNPLTGEKLEIQLGDQNRKHFMNHVEKLAKYIAAAEVVPVEVVETKPKAAKNSENAKVRAWAKENGFNIGDRGRISAEIQAAYAAAHEVIVSESEDAPVKLVETSVEAPESESEPVSETEVTSQVTEPENEADKASEPDGLVDLSTDEAIDALLNEVLSDQLDETTEQQ